MGAGFFAGFGEQFSKTVEDNRKYIRKAKDERRTYLKNYGAKALANQKKDIEKMKKMTSYFTIRGLPSRSVQGLLERGGYAAIQNVYSMLQAKPDLDENDLASLIEVTSGYATEMDMNPVSLFERTLKGARGGEENEPKRKANFFQLMLGNNPYYADEVDAEYPEFVAAIANEGIYPEGLGGDLSGLRLPKDKIDSVRLTAISKRIDDDYKSVIAEDIKQASLDFSGGNDDAGDYLRTLNKIQLLPADRRILEYTKQKPRTMLESLYRREIAEPGAITENSELSLLGEYFKLMVKLDTEYTDDTWEEFYRQQPKDGTKKGLYIISGEPFYWNGFN